MKNIKKIIIISIIAAVILGITACSSSKFTNEERFAARANVAINYSIRDYLPDSVDYTFASLEFYEEHDAKVIRADCSVRLAQGADFVKSVFLLSDKQWYLIDFLRANPDIDAVVTEEIHMELWYISLGDFEFIVNENNLVDRSNTTEIAREFLRTGDKGLLGIN